MDSNRDYAQVIEEQDAFGVTDVTYTYGLDLLSQGRGASSSYYHYDGLGSTRTLTDSAGNVTDSYVYRAFGTVEAHNGLTDNDYLFAGEQFDDGLAQYYLRARYYDPSQGRFTQMDTFAGVNRNPVTLHKYLYANGSPAMFVDPSGYYFSLGSLSIAQTNQTLLITASVGTVAVGLSNVDRFNHTTGDGLTNVKSGWLIILQMGGSAAESLSKLILKKEIDKSAAIAAGQNRALSDVSRSEERYAERKALIGETQKRVVAAANYYMAITLIFDSPFRYSGKLTPNEVLLSMAYNFSWVATLRTQNFIILDIGVDRNRTGSVSPWYLAELAAVRGYENHRVVPWD